MGFVTPEEEELLRNSKDSEMYRLAWLPSWVVSVWSVSPETDSIKDGAEGTISILPQNGEPSGKKFGTSNILKRL